jgi:hypothetical protein
MPWTYKILLRVFAPLRERYVVSLTAFVAEERSFPQRRKDAKGLYASAKSGTDCLIIQRH